MRAAGAVLVTAGNGGFAQVTAVESGRAAVADLVENAVRAEVRVETTEDQAEAFLSAGNAAPDFVLADPPRAGLGKLSAAKLASIRPATLVIVACDPALHWRATWRRCCRLMKSTA